MPSLTVNHSNWMCERSASNVVMQCKMLTNKNVKPSEILQRLCEQLVDTL